jgi:hypothetical protein
MREPFPIDSSRFPAAGQGGLADAVRPALEAFFDDELSAGRHRIGVISFFANVHHPRARRNFTPPPIILSPPFVDKGSIRNGAILGTEAVFHDDQQRLNDQPTLTCTLGAIFSKAEEVFDVQMFTVRLNRAGDLQLIPATWPKLGTQNVTLDEKFHGRFAFANDRIVGAIAIQTGTFDAFDAGG